MSGIEIASSLASDLFYRTCDVSPGQVRERCATPVSPGLGGILRAHVKKDLAELLLQVLVMQK
jgi:hypothetical protein